ncbi:tetratricopeptide repeat protein [Acinetobacter sp. ULE_I001]|uniref:tetratricopeptide repeat protein n=1 Tax=unclassified Acinetobacter TaxID=196816 RepID=UPI003AF9F945
MAQYNLSEEYSDGKNIKQDQNLAHYWHLKAAKNGDVSAQFKLGTLYLDGNLGLPQDINKAKAWLKKAADQGYELAQQQLAVL